MMSQVHFLYNNAGPATPEGRAEDIWCSCRWHFGTDRNAAMEHLMKVSDKFRLEWVLEREQVRVLQETLRRERTHLGHLHHEAEERMGWHGQGSLIRPPTERGMAQLKKYWEAIGARMIMIDELRESLGMGPGTELPPWPDYEQEDK